MDVLPFNFRVCKLCGMWYDDRSFFVLKLFYRIVVIFIIFQFVICQTILLLTIECVSDFTEVLFVFSTYAALYLKMLNFVSRRDEMSSLLKDFRLELFQTKSPEEQEIIQKYSKRASNVFITFMSIAQPTGIVFIFMPLLSSELYLPLKSYQPLDITNAVNFWISYSLQVAVVLYGVALNVTMDTMVYGFVIMITGQYEINCYRLKNSTFSTKDCIKHNVLIQNAVLKIQNFFIPAVVPFFCFSLITLCTSIFVVSQKNLLSLEFLSFGMYLGCMFYQVFFYCWFGNELELKNKDVMDSIYSSQWLDYSATEKKNIWFFMLCTQRKSTISFHGQCSLSLNTFLWIAKSSYASFNLLQYAAIDNPEKK